MRSAPRQSNVQRNSNRVAHKSTKLGRRTKRKGGTTLNLEFWNTSGTGIVVQSCGVSLQESWAGISAVLASD
eukprot:4674568-Amphidinium_carterae.1